MEPSGSDEVDTRLRGRDALRIHFGLLLCLLICIPAFLFEVSRAIGGNELSWAYVVEWPIFIVFGFYMWHRLLQGDAAVSTSRRHAAAPSADDPPSSLATRESAQLDAWNRYLEELHQDEADYDGPGAH